mgnify:CR=1 FL=1
MKNMTHKPDAVEPDRVISNKHCVNCGHLYYDHLVAMNTTQTGDCKHCRCYHPETASREQLWREVGQLTAELDKYRDACERLIGHYGSQFVWICQFSSCVDADCKHPDILYLSNDAHSDGFDFARQVKAEIDGESK